MQNDRQKFIKMATPFFENELLREIYEDEQVSICNLANSSYVLFSYDMIKDNEKNFCGIMFNGKNLKDVVDNPALVLIGFLNSDSVKKKNLLVPLTKDSFEIMKKLKNKTDIMGPLPGIDLEFEKELMTKGKSR